MSNPLYDAFRASSMQGNNIMSQFQQFRQQMSGKDPRQEINRLLQSGAINQQQLNQAQQMAMQMRSMFK